MHVTGDTVLIRLHDSLIFISFSRVITSLHTHCFDRQIILLSEQYTIVRRKAYFLYQVTFRIVIFPCRPLAALD